MYLVGWWRFVQVSRRDAGWRNGDGDRFAERRRGDLDRQWPAMLHPTPGRAV